MTLCRLLLHGQTTSWGPPPTHALRCRRNNSPHYQVSELLIGTHTRPSAAGSYTYTATHQVLEPGR